MVAPKQVELPFFGSVGRQRGCGFFALAHNLSKLQSAAVLTCWNLLRHKIAEIVSGRKNFKTTAKSVGRQILRKQDLVARIEKKP